MSVFSGDKDRSVVPRWRSPRATAAAGELDSSGSYSRAQLPSVKELLEKKQRDWENERTIGHAGDLVAGALVAQQPIDAAKAAATFIVDKGQRSAAGVRRLAMAFLGDRVRPERDEEQDNVADVSAARSRIRRLKTRLQSAPRNPFSWTELARAHSTLGQAQKAERAMEAALALNSTNRYVLRSAARLWVHLDEPDRAHKILLRSPATAEDPWLIAAELAVSNLVDTGPRHARVGSRMLSSRSHGRLQTSELASALATLALISGSHRNSRRLFRQSLVTPTDNSVAQAGWAARLDASITVDPSLLKLPLTYEARAFEARRKSDWQGVIDNCLEWAGDESFSSRPRALGSFVAAAILYDFDLCERLARDGLVGNPFDRTLRNNLAVALANQGQAKSARAEFSKIPRPHSDPMGEATLLATDGLIMFRSGDPETGRALYRASLDASIGEANPYWRASAAMHWWREEMLIGASDHATVAKNSVMKEIKTADTPEIKAIFDRVETVERDLLSIRQ